ncbi:diaminobutyrate--2-oxoglutarate transaminase family protein [Sessilibacter sp. MAH4]
MTLETIIEYENKQAKNDRHNVISVLSDSLTRFLQQEEFKIADNVFLSEQNQTESNARSYPRNIPIAIKKAQGIFVEDTQGQLFIDCLAGAGTFALGHNHPEVVRAVNDYLVSGGPWQTLDLTSPAKREFVKEVFSILPKEFARCAKLQFCGPAGTDAVEAAIKLAKTATKRSGIWSFSGAYHGMTNGTLSLMGNRGTKSPVPDLMANVQFMPYPYEYRCPFGLTGEASIYANLNLLEHQLLDSHSGTPLPAAIVVEAIQGEGGVIPAPLKWLQGLRDLCDRFDVPLIFDEIQCGVGRSGNMFAFEFANIQPDILVMSKAIGGGLPMALIAYHEKLDKWLPGAHTGTFRGNQLAMVAGAKTLQLIRSENILENVRKRGDQLLSALKRLQQDYEFLGDVRGRGLMIGVEIVSANNSPQKPKMADGNIARKIQQLCLHHGLILELGGRAGATVRFLPPLNITQQEMSIVINIFLACVAEVAQTIHEP